MDKKSEKQHIFPPVVTVLGHVDHGKTSLLDAIRKTNIAERESGGITQKIGASSIEVMHDGQKRNITFIDTPGHEAFAKMRSRGAQAADIALLIVSSVDGVMPQTRESIGLIKESGLPFIVVLTKSDVQDKIVEKVKSQLLKEEVMLEGYGGDVPVIEVSARTGSNIKELLELILLVEEMGEKRQASSTDPLKAVVIESKLDQKAGPRATIVVKNGTLNVRDEIVCEGVSGKARTILNDKGAQQNMATVGDAVEILGFAQVPPIGGIVQKKDEAQVQKQQEEKVASSGAIQFIDENKLALVICTDTAGSLEAIINSLPQDKLSIVSAKTGEISEADILLAKSTKAIVVGFNIKIRPDVATLARTEKVLAKNYTIIYELIQEISDVIEGKELALEEKIYGTAQVLASFPFEKTKVMGIRVLDGRIAKGDKIRLLRNDEKIGESTIASARQLKNIVSKIEKGQEGGVVISPFLDFAIGDMIISHD